MALGLNWFPMQRRELRLNVQGLYVEDSATGGSSLPYLDGSNGWACTTDVMLSF